MAERDNGGAAFPYWQEYNGDVESSSGMSLRDWFAGMALQGRLTLKDGRTRDEIVEDAYDDADAMLKERGRAT